MKEFLKPRRIAFGVALGLGGLMTVGCSDTNYSGEGNEFVVVGRVTDPGNESLKAAIYEIKETQGVAETWFEVGNEHQLHDNCNCHGFWRNNKRYGEVRDEEGQVIDSATVAIDVCVEFTGAIRKYSEGEGYSERPVYETAQIIPCE